MKVSSNNIWDVSHPAFSPESIDVPDAFRKVMENIERENRKPEKSSGRIVHVWRIVSSFIAVPAMVLAFFVGIMYSQSIYRDFESFNQTTTTPYGTRTSMTLADGSRVWLNSGSSLSYPNAFGKGERIVSLTGEAFFEVESDPERPFIVKTGSLDVRATGTAFNVNSYDSDNVTSVMLERGKVKLSTPDNANGIDLMPGNLLTMNEISGNISVKETDPYTYSSWRDGILIFIDTPMTEVFNRLSQIYNVDFIIKDTSLATHLYKATFDGDSLNDILDIMAFSSSICYRKSVSSNGRKTIEVYALR